MSLLALSDSFEYLCYGSTAIRNISTFTVRGSTSDMVCILVQVTIYRRLRIGRDDQLDQCEAYDIS